MDFIQSVLEMSRDEDDGEVRRGSYFLQHLTYRLGNSNAKVIVSRQAGRVWHLNRAKER